jgi:hypothetical protein
MIKTVTTLLSIIIFFCLAPNHLLANESDYLGPVLRNNVEQLKLDVKTSPTDSTNVENRSQIMWDWVNAFALNGGYVPVNLTADIRPNPADSANRRAILTLDNYVAELAMHEDTPRAIGTLNATLGPFEANSWGTIQQIYTLGERPITKSGGVIVAKHFMANHGPFQTTDPSSDNHVSIQSSNPTVLFESSTSIINGMHGGFRGAAPVLFFRVISGQLTEGDQITITYGGKGDGARGLKMPSFSTDRMPFPLYLDFDGSDVLFSLPIQPIRVVGSTISGVHAFAPSIVRPNENFSLSVRAEDADFNRAQPPYPHWKVFANDKLLGEIQSSDQAIATLTDVAIEKPGAYQILVRSADGRIQGEGNPILVSATHPRIFWGDTHGHSGFAEGIGTPDRFMQWAKEDARLDFVTHSEHDIWTDDREWNVLKENVEQYSEENRFIAYLGYEWTTRNLYGGHHNVLFRTAKGRHRVSTQFYPRLSELYAALKSNNNPDDVVVIPHAHQSGNYRLGDPTLQPLIEIMSQHGSFEWFGKQYLKHGQQVGFIAASDNHLSQPGYTSPKGKGLSQRGGLGAVFAKSISRNQIFDAMKNRQTYATTGERLILDLSLNGANMGERVDFSGSRKIEGRVIGTDAIESITLLKNGIEIQQIRPTSIITKPELDDGIYTLSFESDSTPKHPGDNPRGWRPWTGTLSVKRASLSQITSTDFYNPNIQSITAVEDNPGTYRFATATRGDSSSLNLNLSNISNDATIIINLEENQEFGSGPPIFRKHALVPATTVKISLQELAKGSVSQSIPFDVYEDRVTLKRLNNLKARDVPFEFSDNSDRQGDYYFIRIKQVDDSLAWSSPIWVGGFPIR